VESNNSKIITLSLALFSAIIGFAVHKLIISFAGAFGVIARLAGSDFVRHIFPVALALVLFLTLQFSSKIVAWADEVVSELKKVVFPSRKDTTAMTVVVVVMVLVSSVIITTFDFLSGYVLRLVMN
jgi:preprotein translocase subunit SecE